jgi:anti-sigma regulatory factor (Ser/Thr protein kinase)/serine/threonine protein phosphatase PrpC
MVISSPAEVIAIRRISREMAKNIGFSEPIQEEIVLVVSELATNIIKYANRGIVTLTPVSLEGQNGLMIEAADSGPGFNENIALKDGFSSSGTLGCGLGAVNRMMDEFDIHINENDQSGTRIVCKRWLRSKSSFSGRCPFDFGIVSRPKPGEDVNGDSFVIKHGNGQSLVSVIDGVGHGRLAHHAAQAARHYIEDHDELPFLDIFRGVERACRSSRGVVMALASFDWANMKLTYASVGNIEVKVFGAEEKFKFIVRRGIVGKNAPNPVITENNWQPNYALALHSDGLSTHWNWDDFSRQSDKSAQVMAEHMHRSLKKDNDDTTLIIVK